MLPRKINCKEASRLISQGFDREMTMADRISLRVHLTVCEACTKFRAQLEFLRKAVAALAGRGDDDK